MFEGATVCIPNAQYLTSLQQNNDVGTFGILYKMRHRQKTAAKQVA